MSDIAEPVHARLVAAAITLFAARGYHATRVADIVQQAGVAQGTFYLYFTNKEAIFTHIIDDFFARMLGATLVAYPPLTNAMPPDHIAQVRAIWRVLLRLCREQRDVVQLVLWEAGALGPAFATHIRANYAQVVAALAAYGRKAMLDGIYRQIDPDLAGWAVLGMALQGIQYAVLVNPESDIDQTAEDLLQLEFRGLLNDSWRTLTQE